MELVLSWLKEYVDVDLPLPELAHQLTMLGLEVEDVRLIGLPMPTGENKGFTFHGLEWDKEKFVVAQVDEVMPHPNADRLVLCRLNDGQGEHTVLTGAPNLYDYKGKGPLDPPLKVAYAKEGARLYDGHKPGFELTTLKRATIRGVESTSMICSEKELGISEDHEGVMILDDDAPTGAPLADYLGDAVYSISIPANMVRCSSMIGLAREVAAYLDQPLRMPDMTLPKGEGKVSDAVKIEIRNPELNPRFVAGLIRNVEARPSPYMVQLRLKLSGMRPINSIVDATNYVMLEAGQPLHAFDYDVLVKRAGGKTPTIITRTAEQGEKLTTLDDVEHTLEDYTVLVADTAGSLSIGGIMGGAESEIRPETTDILLEGASWNFINLRKSLKYLRINSEAGYRLSRGVHPTLAEVGVRLCLKRMLEWSGGQLAEGLVDNYPLPYDDPTVTITTADIKRLIGIDLTAEEIAGLLRRLMFECEVKGDAVTATAPPHRMDIGVGVNGRADLAEEVARLYGYENIPSVRLDSELPPLRSNPQEERNQLFQDTLVSMGLQEVISYRFTNPEQENRIYPPQSKPQDEAYVELQNPIAVDKNVLRRSLLASVLDNLERNARQRERLALFEIGPVFLPVKDQLLPDEPMRVAIAICGLRHPSAWDQKDKGTFDFFDLKGMVEGLLKALHVTDIQFEADSNPSFHPGKCAVLRVSGEKIGWLGELHPQVMANYDFGEHTRVQAADLDMDKLFSLSPKYFETNPITAFPPVIEDLAMIAPESTPSAEIVRVIKDAGGFLLKQVELFDIFRGQQIGAGNKSLAYRLTYQAPNRTLNDKEVGKQRTRIIAALEKELDVKVRQAE
jgi:phenylalanyl-tRNA synthetase beta chain